MRLDLEMCVWSIKWVDCITEQFVIAACHTNRVLSFCRCTNVRWYVYRGIIPESIINREGVKEIIVEKTCIRAIHKVDLRHARGRVGGGRGELANFENNNVIYSTYIS